MTRFAGSWRYQWPPLVMAPLALAAALSPLLFLIRHVVGIPAPIEALLPQGRAYFLVTPILLWVLLLVTVSCLSVVGLGPSGRKAFLSVSRSVDSGFQFAIEHVKASFLAFVVVGVLSAITFLATVVLGPILAGLRLLESPPDPFKAVWPVVLALNVLGQLLALAATWFAARRGIGWW